MGDLFHKDIPLNFIAEIFCIMASATAECGKNHKQHEDECWTGDPHTYMILTKRPERMKEVMRSLPGWVADNLCDDSALSISMDIGAWPLPNLWIGVTAENQQTADERIPILLQIPAAKRFVSIEPMLGPVVMPHLLDWIILGGETGPGARPMHPWWVESVRDQCQSARVPFFFKGWGAWREAELTGGYLPGRICLSENGEYWPSQHRMVCYPNESDGMIMRKFRNKAERLHYGKKIDGRTWEEFPA